MIRAPASNLVMRFPLYLLALAFGLTFWSAPTHDPDLGWHLLGGSWIISNAKVPSFDMINSFNPEWHDYHWLGQIFMFLIFKFAGYEGLRFALGLLMFWLGKVVIDVLLLVRNSKRLMFLNVTAFLFTMTLVSHVTSIRPQMLSILILLIALRRVLQRKTSWEIPFLFLLTILLVNIHVYWVFVPFIWFFFRVLGDRETIKEIRPINVLAVLLLFASAGLVSPYGIIPGFTESGFILKNYALLYDYMIMPKELRSAIGELQGALASDGLTPWLLTFFLIVSARAFSFRRFLVKPGIWLVSFVTLALAIRSLKFLSVFAVCSIPLLIVTLDRVFPVIFRRTPSKVEKLGQVTLYAFILCYGIAAWIYFPWRYDVSEYMNSYLPVTACKEIAHTSGIKPAPGRDHVRVLTHFNHGGWCRWMIYQEDPKLDYRVTVDGRTQWVPPAHYELGFDLYNVKNNWLKTLQEWNPDVALVPKDKPLAQILYRLPDKWKLVYQDDFFGVFVPVRG